MGIDEGGLDPILGQGVGHQVEAAAVDGLLGHDVATVRGQRLDGVGDGCGAGGDHQCGAAAFQSGKTLLQDLLGGVGQPAVDVAGVGQAKAVCRVLAVMENIRSGLVDGDGAGVGRRIGLFLSYVQLQCLEFEVTHDFILPDMCAVG